MIIRNAQSIFEYFILTSVIAALLLTFASSDYFIKIQEAFNSAFNRSCEEIIE